jgi:hypothetical protein
MAEEVITRARERTFFVEDTSEYMRFGTKYERYACTVPSGPDLVSALTETLVATINNASVGGNQVTLYTPECRTWRDGDDRVAFQMVLYKS